MKLPSLNSLLEKSSRTLKRFPFALLFTFLGAGIAIYAIRHNYNPEQEHHYLFNGIMSCYLGMLLFIALTIYSERKKWNVRTHWTVQFAGLALITGYYFSLPEYFLLLSNIRFALFSLALHLLIAFAPFLVRNEVNGFWQYNKNLFLRITVTALYSGVLFLGLALAIAAIDKLFKVHIDEKAFAYLWVMIVVVFNTWFFLSGFPDEFPGLESKTDYPKGLKIFTQYVLLPLIAVYLLILYSYLFKIVVQMQWPDGWVSYLVLFFSVAGILSLLLIHPVRNDESNKWIPVFSKFFYFAIFPLIVLLFFAIKRRISDYGITESRYFVLLLALWLLFIAAYFLASKSKNIKLIPLSLCIIALLSSFGPWGAFSVSLRSQQKHLSELLLKNNMLASGKVKQVVQKIPLKDNREITSVVDYLVESHGCLALQDFFVVNLDSLMKKDSVVYKRYNYDQSRKIMELMGLSYVSGYDSFEADNFNYNCETDYLSNIEGYDFYISNFNVYGDSFSKEYLHDTVQYKIKFKRGVNKIYITSQVDSLSFTINTILDSAEKNNAMDKSSLPSNLMTLTASCTDFSAKLILTHLSGNREERKLLVTNLSAVVFIKQHTTDKQAQP